MNRFIHWTEKAALAVCAGAVFIMMVVGAIDIVMGNVLGFYLSFKVELSGTLLASSIFLACGPVQRDGEHIKVDFFQSSMGHTTKKLSQLLGSLCGLLVIGLITYGLCSQASKSIAIFEISADTLSFPIWPWKLACFIGSSLCLITMIGQFAQQIFTFPSRKDST